MVIPAALGRSAAWLGGVLGYAPAHLALEAVPCEDSGHATRKHLTEHQTQVEYALMQKTAPSATSSTISLSNAATLCGST